MHSCLGTSNTNNIAPWVHGADTFNCRVEIGYNVAFGVQGKGIATFAVNKLCQIAFESGLVKVVFALISSENSASLNVVRKNGFIYKNIAVDSDGESLECWELSNNINAL
nr:GNAT family N-acetyltransferase [Vibrio cholerae]